jgi:Phage T7 tail fibre protein
MATATLTLGSQNRWLADGSTTVWNFNFVGGYIDRDHVRAYTLTDAMVPVRNDLVLDRVSSFVSDFALRITPAVPAGYTLVVYRDSSNGGLPITDFADGAGITESSLDILAKQSVFVSAETEDFIGTATEGGLANTLAAVTSASGSAHASMDNAAASAVVAGAGAAAANGFALAASASAVAAALSEANAGAIAIAEAHIMGVTSVMQSIPDALHADIYARTSTTNVAPYFQALIDQGIMFSIPQGASFWMGSRLNWKSGARMMCYNGQDYQLGASPDAWATELVFDTIADSVGINFHANVSGEGIHNWSWKGFRIRGTGANRLTTWKAVNVQNGVGFGAFEFRIEDVSISNCFHAVYADDALFTGVFSNLLIEFAVNGITKTTTDFITSWTGSINFYNVVFPWNLNNATYCDISCFIDTCGLSASTVPYASATDMPILFRANNVLCWNFKQLGIEQSNAMVFKVENFSQVSASISYYNDPSHIWSRSSTRISNCIEAEQALFSVRDSQVQLQNMRLLWWVVSGYPAASTNPAIVSYFAQLIGGSGVSKLSLVNCTLALECYCAHPAGQFGLSAPALFNGPVTFGANSITLFNSFLDYTNGFLSVGSVADPTLAYHRIVHPNAFVEGTDFIKMIGAPAASSSIICRAVNGVASNSAISAVRIGTAASNSRSLNAGGTGNFSGADIAEYERNRGLVIVKGQIVGFRADGTLTLTYSEAIRFGIKSTAPSIVGGDTWAVTPEPPEGSSAEVMAVFAARHEEERKAVDRIAYCGKVPCNVWGTSPGQYIVASVGPGDTIIGMPITSPEIQQYLQSVGRVNRVLDDGRAEVVVISH